MTDIIENHIYTLEPEENSSDGEETRSPREIEQEEEMKLKSKYGGLTRGRGMFAQKHLVKGGGHKYFDSGDYNLVQIQKKGKLNKEDGSLGSGKTRTKPEAPEVVPPSSQGGENESEAGDSSHSDDITDGETPNIKEAISDDDIIGKEIPTADAIISRRMALFRTKSGLLDVSDDGVWWGSWPVPEKSLRRATIVGSGISKIEPSLAPPELLRRASMFPGGPGGPRSRAGSDSLSPPQDILNRRRGSCIPAIPSKLTTSGDIQL